MSAVLQPVEFQFPEKVGGILIDEKSGRFKRSRFKVAYGGRDGAKSWSFARALLLEGAERPMRIGCFREIQNSIADSVHKLLKDQIGNLGLSGFYEPTKNEIRGKNGTEFLFSGSGGVMVLLNSKPK